MPYTHTYEITFNFETVMRMIIRLDPASVADMLGGVIGVLDVDVVAFDNAGKLVFSSLPDDDYGAGVIAYLTDHLSSAREQGRLILRRAGNVLTIYPQVRRIRGNDLAIFSIRVKPAQTERAGIAWQNADEVRAAYESSAFGIVEGKSVSPLVTDAYARGVPIMLEGEPGAGKTAAAQLLYLQGDAANKPFVHVSCDVLNERNWRHLIKSPDSPLFNNGITLYLSGLQALGSRAASELFAAIEDSAAAQRARLLLSGNDVPGGGESDAVALFAERLHAAVCVVTPLRERGSVADRVARYLDYLVHEFDTPPLKLSERATEKVEAYAWPRNYMQLREVAERLFIVAGRDGVSELDAASVDEVLAQEDVIRSATFSTPKLDTDLFVLRPLADTERDIARLVVDHLDGNRTRAAEVLGVSRTTLWRLLK